MNATANVTPVGDDRGLKRWGARGHFPFSVTVKVGTPGTLYPRLRSAGMVRMLNRLSSGSTFTLTMPSPTSTTPASPFPPLFLLPLTLHPHIQIPHPPLPALIPRR